MRRDVRREGWQHKEENKEVVHGWFRHTTEKRRRRRREGSLWERFSWLGCGVLSLEDARA